MNETNATAVAEKPARKKAAPPAEQPPRKYSLADIEHFIASGNLDVMKPEERTAYYIAVCESLGLNPATRPFEYLKMRSRGGGEKTILYARKDCADQLRARDGITIEIIRTEVIADVLAVTVRASTPEGRTDDDIGAVELSGSASDRANAVMKALTKAKRRVTLSICGLGFTDDSEVDTIPGAERLPAQLPARTPAPQQIAPPMLPAPQQAAPAAIPSPEKPAAPPAPPAAPVPASPEALAEIGRLREELAVPADAFTNRLIQLAGVNEPAKLDEAGAKVVLAALKAAVAKKKATVPQQEAAA
jgi:hypothetical protein